MAIKVIIITALSMCLTLLIIYMIFYIMVIHDGKPDYDKEIEDLEQIEYIKKYRLYKSIKQKLNQLPRRCKYNMSKEFKSHEEFKTFMTEMNEIYEDYIVDCGIQDVTSPITNITTKCNVYQINNEDSTTTVAFNKEGRLFTIV